MESNNLKWYYNGKKLEDDQVPDWAVGFVYRIEQYVHAFCREGAEQGMTFFPDKVYIGKKTLTSTRKSAVGKRAMKKQLEEATDKRRVKKVQVKVKDSGWRNYTGSCKELNEAIKVQPELFRKEIIEFAHSKKHLSYLETKHQFLENVLENDSWNGHIQNWYKKDLIRNNGKE